MNERKYSRYNKIIHNAIQTYVEIYQRTKRFFVTVQTKNTCKLEFADHLWLPFFDQS